MSDERIIITKQIRQLILDARKSTNLPASDLSTMVKNSMYWLPNIENGRTKSIQKNDLIKILVIAYEYSNEDAEKAITDALKNVSTPLSSDNKLSDMEIRPFQIYKEDGTNLEDISKYQKEFEDSKNDIMKGFDIFFERITNKKEVLEMMGSIRHGFHSDLGFMISMLALPWCRLKELPIEKKQEIMKEILNIIKINGSCDNCKHKNKNDCK